jgi:hypothetical protein
MDIDTLRVFSFSGGSTKGYGENYFIKKFLQQWGVSQVDFWNKMSDVERVEFLRGFEKLDQELEERKRMFIQSGNKE